MGTSNAYGGPGGGTPLIPSWLRPDADVAPAQGDNQQGNEGGSPERTDPGEAPSDAPSTTIPQPALLPNRFTTPRNNFSRFAGSGGSDRSSLGRAVSNYVSRASGGTRQAAQRMGSSTNAGARLLGFLSDAQARGAREALRALNLEGLAGRPIEEIFIGLSTYVCPDSGTIDEGIARDAFIETIADLAEAGITDLDGLTPDQLQTVFELYATHAIENRICNDIGAKLVRLPQDVRAAQRVQVQLRDFIRRGVGDALTLARAALAALTPERVLGFVGGVYESAFRILQAMADTEAQWA